MCKYNLTDDVVQWSKLVKSQSSDTGTYRCHVPDALIAGMLIFMIMLVFAETVYTDSVAIAFLPMRGFVDERGQKNFEIIQTCLENHERPRHCVLVAFPLSIATTIFILTMKT